MVVVQCDKGRGFSLFGLEKMAEVDKELMKQFGAEETILSDHEVMIKVLNEIKKFEDSLGLNEKEYIDFVFKDRNINIGDIALPFLKSVHKVHKMSKAEIDDRDTSNLKFRPVIDARRWMTRGYSELAMKMLRKLNYTVINQGGSILKSSCTKGVWEYVEELRNFNCVDKYVVMISADIQEAYTNVTENMICKAINRLNKIALFDDWKIQLLEKLVKLILRNNYVETSGGIYLFKPVLPMGYIISGEGLNSVALSGEVDRLFYSDGVSNECRVKIAEINNYPMELVDYSVEREGAMGCSIRKYKRYVDDSHAIISGSD